MAAQRDPNSANLHFKILEHEKVNDEPEATLAESVDLFLMDRDGRLKFAKARTIAELKDELVCFNRSFYGNNPGNKHGNSGQDNPGTLSLLRCDPFKKKPSNSNPRLSSDPHAAAGELHRASTPLGETSLAGQEQSEPLDLKLLNEFFDQCSKPDSDGYGLTMKKQEPHCQWTCTKSKTSEGVRCVKFSYSLATPSETSLSLSHHFHAVSTLKEGIIEKIEASNNSGDMASGSGKAFENRISSKQGEPSVEHIGSMSKGSRALDIMAIADIPGNSTTAVEEDLVQPQSSKVITDKPEGSSEIISQDNVKTSGKFESKNSALPPPPTVFEDTGAGKTAKASSPPGSNDASLPKFRHVILKCITKEMARGFTVGIKCKDLKRILFAALEFKKRSSLAIIDPAGLSTYQGPTLHPKAVVLGILEDFEVSQRDAINNYEKYIKSLEDRITSQRLPANRNNNQNQDGLATCSIELSESNVELGLIRPKIQYLSSSIAALESCQGVPGLEEDLDFLLDREATKGASAPKPAELFGKFWAGELNEIDNRLLRLGGKCDQCRLDVKTLQHRVTGNLLMVSNLLAQRENDWIHETEEQRNATTVNQIEMLKKQEIIAERTKLDSAMMKYIAMITAFFLPGTFVAILFTVPMFEWDDETVGYIKPSAFKLYWKITAPITGVLVAGLCLWVIKVWCEDRIAHKRDRKKKAKEAEDKRIKEALAVKDANTERIIRRGLDVAMRHEGDQEEARTQDS